MFAEQTINKDVQGLYSDGSCYYNAEYNRLHAFKSLGLKWVVGGLGMNGWFEYGGKKGFNYSQKWNDSHAWLEDADGNVYDYCQPSWAWYCSANGVSDKLPLGVEFRGVSKDELKKMGLEYVAAPAKDQKMIQERAFRTKDLMMCLTRGWTPQPIKASLAGY
jgi:hypothetical protein